MIQTVVVNINNSNAKVYKLVILSMTIIFGIISLSTPLTSALTQDPKTTATLLSTNCQPVWVSGNTMIFNMQKANGLWDAYIGNTNCSNATPLLPTYAGHRERNP
jgi:hypothetical protein